MDSEALRELERLNAKRGVDEIRIGNFGALQKALEDQGVQFVENKEGYSDAFMGIPIKTDARIPDGVYVIVPPGKSMADPECTIGAVSEEYRETAASFSRILAWGRRTGSLAEEG